MSRPVDDEGECLSSGADMPVVNRLSLAEFELLRSLVPTRPDGTLSGDRNSELAKRLIRRIEQTTGLDLIVRVGVNDRLTAAGEAVVDSASAVSGAAREFSDVCDTFAGTNTRTLRISANEEVADELLPHWIETAGRLLRGVSFAVTVANSGLAHQHLRAGSSDISIISGIRQDPELVYLLVDEDDLLVIANSRSAWGEGPRLIDRRSLARADLVVRESGSGPREAFDSALSKYREGVRIEVNTNSGVIDAVRQSNMAGVVSRLSLAKLGLGGLGGVTVVNGPFISLPIRLVATQLGARSPLVRQFVRVIREEVSDNRS